MEKNIIISVIIPVYNAEKTLCRAVDSVLAQANDQIELLLVNDGSSDGSGAICDKYGQTNSRVRVIHQANGGPCAARNTGIKAATGEYIMFLDSDDYLAADACDTVAKVIAQHHPDCIDFGWCYVKQSEIVENNHKIPKNVLLDENAVKNLILPPLLHLVHDPDHLVYDFACVKAFRRQIMMENAAFFDEGRRTWEDRFFVIQYLRHCQSYYSIDRCFYYYVFTEGSLSQWYTPDYFRIMLSSFRQYVQMYAGEYDFDTQFVNDYWCRAIENMIYRSLQQTEDRDAINEQIFITLRDEQVIHWYQNRLPQNAFETKANALVVEGKVEAALHHYEKKAARDRRRNAVHKSIFYIRNCVKVVISRVWHR